MFSPYGAYPLNRFELTYKLHHRHRYRSASGSFVNQAGASWYVRRTSSPPLLITFAIWVILYAILILRISTFIIIIQMLLHTIFSSLYFLH